MKGKSNEQDGNKMNKMVIQFTKWYLNERNGCKTWDCHVAEIGPLRRLLHYVGLAKHPVRRLGLGRYTPDFVAILRIFRVKNTKENLTWNTSLSYLLQDKISTTN